MVVRVSRRDVLVGMAALGLGATATGTAVASPKGAQRMQQALKFLQKANDWLGTVGVQFIGPPNPVEDALLAEIAAEATAMGVMAQAMRGIVEDPPADPPTGDPPPSDPPQ